LEFSISTVSFRRTGARTDIIEPLGSGRYEFTTYQVGTVKDPVFGKSTTGFISDPLPVLLAALNAAAILGTSSKRTVAPDTVLGQLAANVSVVVPAPELIVVEQ